MPASGPTPGSTPTSVPTRQPMKPYQKTWGARATEKPRPRFWSVSSTSEPEGSPGQGHPEQGVEDIEGSPRHHDRHGEAEDPPFALECQDEEGDHHRHGDPVAQALEPPRRERAGGEDRDGVAPFMPADLGHSASARSHDIHRHAEGNHEDGEHHRHVRGARPVQRAQGEGSALPDGDDPHEYEGGAGQAIRCHRASRTVFATCPLTLPSPPLWGGGEDEGCVAPRL